MATLTPIEWTDRTWNPTRGCSRKSPGCLHCYAEPIARRFSGPGKPYEGLVHPSGAWNGRITLVEEGLDAPVHWRKPQMVFVNSMSDLFHENIPFEFVDKVFAVMARAREHTYQVLTKRTDRMQQYMSDPERRDNVLVASHQVPFCAMTGIPRWPLPNVWLGTSVENQATVDERVPVLCDTPAAVRFLSCEPLLEEINILPAISRANITRSPIGWVIIGGESGPKARPFNIDWARNLLAQCYAMHGVAPFVKQLGAKPFLHRKSSVSSSGPGFRLSITGAEVNTQFGFADRKGGDMAEWPEDLRVREFPKVAA